MFGPASAVQSRVPEMKHIRHPFRLHGKSAAMNRCQESKQLSYPFSDFSLSIMSLSHSE